MLPLSLGPPPEVRSRRHAFDLAAFGAASAPAQEALQSLLDALRNDAPPEQVERLARAASRLVDILWGAAARLLDY